MRINKFVGRRIILLSIISTISASSVSRCNRDRDIESQNSSGINGGLSHAHLLKESGYDALKDGDSLFQARDTTAAQNLWREAVDYFDESINIEYRDVNTIEGRAYALKRLGDLEGALQEYQHAAAMAETLGIANNRDNAPLYNDIGTLYVELKQYDKAREAYQRALSVDPEYQTPKRNLALLDQKGY